MAHIVEGGDGLRDVERLGMCRGGYRHYPDGRRAGGDPCRDEHGIESSTHLVCPFVDGAAPSRLHGQRILNGHKVEQTPFGLLDEIDPVAG